MNNRWPQQGVFIARVKEHCEKNGLLTKRGAVNIEILADLFNITEDTLRQFLYDSTRRRPHLDTLASVARVVGCSVAEFLDSPCDPPPGMAAERWEAMSENERSLATSLMAEIASEELSPADKEALHNIFLAAKASIIQLKKQA